MYSPNPKERYKEFLKISASQKRKLLSKIPPWPMYSPGTINAWLVFLGASPGDSPGEKPWDYDHNPTTNKPHPGVSEYKDSRGYWDGIRLYSEKIFYDLTPDQAYSLTMVRNFDPTQASVAPTGNNMKKAAKEVYQCFDTVIKPRLIIALGGVRNYSDPIFIGKSEEEFSGGFLFTSNKRGKRKWSATRGTWSTSEKWLYVTASGIHPSLQHVSKEDILNFFSKISNMARAVS